MTLNLILKLLEKLPPEKAFEKVLFLSNEGEVAVKQISKMPDFPIYLNLLLEDYPRSVCSVFGDFITDEHIMILRERGYDDQGRMYPGS